MAIPLRDLRAERERVIARLCDAFAEDLFDEDDLERRMDVAHRAVTLEELRAITADLPLSVTDVPAPASSAAPRDSNRALVTLSRASLAERKHRHSVLAVFGNAARKGSWVPAAQVHATSVFGNVELDFREVHLPPGETRLRARSVFGNVTIVVPPDLAVEVEGVGVFGNFEHLDRAPALPDPEAPLLRVSGYAVFGNVEVETRLPGESDWRAWKRRRRELRGLPPKRE